MAQGLSNGDEHSAYTPFRSMAIFYLYVVAIAEDMLAVKLFSNTILQLLTRCAS